MNRPFLYSKQNVRESIFSQINHLSRNVFCFFSSRKENVPRNRPPKSSTALVALQQAGNGEPAFFSAVTHGAADALVSPGHVSSLLPVGVREFEGDFRKDDIVLIVGPDGATVGVGRAAMDKDTAVKQAFAAKQKPLVHYDYLYVYPKVSE